jgi:hypothetical protein
MVGIDMGDGAVFLDRHGLPRKAQADAGGHTAVRPILHKESAFYVKLAIVVIAIKLVSIKLQVPCHIPLDNAGWLKIVECQWQPRPWARLRGYHSR